MMCGSSVIHEEAVCYSKGSQCEKWHKEGKSLRHIALRDKSHSEDLNTIMDDNVSDLTFDSKLGKNFMDQCGVQPNSKSSTPPWALRIIGKLKRN